MKKVLGLDLGVGSVGWAAITIDDEQKPLKLLGMGSRVIPLSVDETTGFTKGNGESVCAARTLKRSMRRGMDRFQQRRRLLASLLEECGMTFDKALLDLSPMELWQLRADAATDKKLTLAEIGRVIYHINGRRGYRHSKEESNDKKQSDYLFKITNRVGEAAQLGLTPGQYFAQKLKESEYSSPSGKKAWSYRIKEQVFLRKSYEEELYRILSAQSRHYPEILTPERINRIEEAIFFQRPLKSCKHLVSLCEFESHEITSPTGKKIVIGPRVAPASSPIAQESRIWEAINNIVLKNYRNKSRKLNSDQPMLPLFSNDMRKMQYEYHLTQEERKRVFDFLDIHEKMTGSDLLKILGLTRDDGFTIPANISKGLKGNKTKVKIAKALGISTKRLEEIQRLKCLKEQEDIDELELSDIERLLIFELPFEDYVDMETGVTFKKVSSNYQQENFYQLWHTLYSISDKEELEHVLKNKFGIDNQEVLDNLFMLDFRADGYANKSAKFICKILPFMIFDGMMYSEACLATGTRHSESLNKEENEQRVLKDHIELLKKGELRQPVVEKILNQMINLVNAAIEQYGPFDEIRIELARELKRSKDERSADYTRNSMRERENASIGSMIMTEFGMRPSVNKVQKYRMWEESEKCCMYCGQPVNVKEFLMGIDAEKEHVIPRSLFFDDSFSNKVCSCRKCNAAKGQQTAYDFVASQGENALKAYIDRITGLHNKYKNSKGKNGGISKTKFDRLMTSRKDIPQDFIERDLRLSQYIARKAMSILREVCRDVYATSGSVTDFFRHTWGYDEILHNLNLSAYSKAGQTEMVEYEHKGQTHIEERIVGWSKRLDHRHHAVDALTISLTRQGYIQRLNTLNTIREKEEADGGEEYVEKMGNLQKWAASLPHFSTSETADAVRKIAVSFKSGVKATTPGKRYIKRNGKRVLAQTDILVPRGSLTEESVYGIRSRLKKDCSLKELFANPELICDNRLKQFVTELLEKYEFNQKKAISAYKKSPLKNAKGDNIESGSIWEKYVVLRYHVESIDIKKLDKVIDGAVRESIRQRLEEVDNSATAFAASLKERPLTRLDNPNIPIKRVRCETSVHESSIMPVKSDANGREIGFSKYGANHHVGLYLLPDGSVQELVVPFAQAVERKLNGISPIISDPDAEWLKIQNMDKTPSRRTLERLPLPGSKLIVSMQINNMFILGLTDDEITDTLNSGDKATLAAHLYRVQKVSSNDYNFKKHTFTLADTTNEQFENGNYIRITSIQRFKTLNPIKVKVDKLGNIIFPDSYLT